MQIKETISFITQLKQSQINKSYIIKKNNGSFECGKKSAKNLKTAQISDIAKECLQSIVTVENIPFEKRCLLLNVMICTLQEQSKRIIKSKPWWARIASFFGFKSKEEKALNQNIKLAAEQLNQYLKFHCNKEHILRENPNRQLKDFYHKVLDSANIEKLMDGSNPAYVSSVVLKDLMAYMQHLVEGNPDWNEEKLKWNEELFQVQKELSFAHNMSVFYQTKEAYDPGKRKMQEANFLGELQQLKMNNPKLDKTVLLLGGSKKHAVCFQFKIENDGYFSLSVINTGSGATPSSMLIPNKKHKLLSDVKYTGIQFEDFKPGFLEKLLFLNNVKERKMKDVYSILENDFGSKAHIKKTNGRTHKNQVKGTCAAKSISCWLNERLTPKVYREYKAFMTKRKLTSLQQYTKSISKKELNELANKYKMSASNMKAYMANMLVEGEKVLQKRLKKIPA